MNAPHPLLARLMEATGRPALDAPGLEDFLAEPGDSLVFCGGDPVQYPECLDVAVVLPELLAAFPAIRRAAVAGAGLEQALQARYGFQRWPTLLFLRDGGYVGAVSGMQDWGVYLDRVTGLLASPVGRPPSIGVAVAAQSAPHCH